MTEQLSQVFEIPARPLDTTADSLYLLRGDTIVSYSSNFGGYEGAGQKPASSLVVDIQIIVNRQKQGLFTLCEAAQVLADASNTGADVVSLKKKMTEAFKAGKLPIRDPSDECRLQTNDTVRDFYHLVAVDDVNAWLSAEGVGYQFPETDEMPQLAHPDPVISLNAIQFSFGTQFIHFCYLPYFLTEARWFERVTSDIEDVEFLKVVDRWHYRNALWKAVEKGDLVLRHHSENTPLDYSPGKPDARIDESFGCVSLGDFTAYAKNIGVVVTVTEKLKANEKFALQNATLKRQETSNWKTLARDKAKNFIAAQKLKDLYPSQIIIAETIAAYFQKNNIVGADGKPLKAAYIKRHALTGISSATNKQLSTKNTQGK